MKKRATHSTPNEAMFASMTTRVLSSQRSAAQATANVDRMSPRIAMPQNGRTSRVNEWAPRLLNVHARFTR